MNTTIEKNIEHLRLRGVCNDTAESLGGNAGYWHGLPCYAKSFFYHPETGNILLFANPQDAPEDIRQQSKNGVIRIAEDIEE